MQVIGRVLVASAVLLGACAGGENAGTTDTTTTAAPAAGAEATPPATTPAATPGAAGTAGATGAAAPVTGTTHEVKMVGDDKGYRYEPANIKVKQGDAIKFTMVSGGPHNVAFDPAKVPDNVEKQLSANMPNQMSPLSSQFFMNPGESYTISFGGIKPGSYEYFCTPHLAMNMKGTITVQ